MHVFFLFSDITFINISARWCVTYFASRHPWKQTKWLVWCCFRFVFYVLRILVLSDSNNMLLTISPRRIACIHLSRTCCNVKIKKNKTLGKFEEWKIGTSALFCIPDVSVLLLNQPNGSFPDSRNTKRMCKILKILMMIMMMMMLIIILRRKLTCCANDFVLLNRF